MFSSRVTFPPGKQLSCHLAQVFLFWQHNLTSNTPCLTRTAWSCAPRRAKGTPGAWRHFQLPTETSCHTGKHQHQAKAGELLLDTIPLLPAQGIQQIQVLPPELGKE